MKLTEKHVQAIWYDDALRPKSLLTCNGMPVRVVSPGEWNLEEGPDFKNAVLLVGREERRLTGDVEVHMCPSDYDIHGHGSDPNYRNVIAHVTWRGGKPPASLPPSAVSIWIGKYIAKDRFSPDSIDIDAYPYDVIRGRPEGNASAAMRNPDYAKRTLLSAGRRRLSAKSRRIEGRLAEAIRYGISRRQVFYEEMMSTFGYRRNSAQFRRVAERIPINELPREPEGARNAFLAAGSFEEWDCRCCRPNNSPSKRLNQAAKLFSGDEVMKLLDADDFSVAAEKGMMSLLCREGDVGKGRASAMITNVVVPFAMAEGRITSAPEWLPPEELSSPVRLGAYKLFGHDHNPAALYSRNGVLIQGVIDLVKSTMAGRKFGIIVGK